MSERAEEIKQTVKAYLLREHLPGEPPDTLSDSRPLLTAGVLDSLASMQLVTFLEDRYGIAIEAHEVAVDYLDTVADIARLVESKVPR